METKLQSKTYAFSVSRSKTWKIQGSQILKIEGVNPFLSLFKKKKNSGGKGAIFLKIWVSCRQRDLTPYCTFRERYHIPRYKLQKVFGILERGYRLASLIA